MTFVNHPQTKTAMLISYTREIAALDPLAFLRSAPPNTQRIFWQHQNTPLAFAGYGVAATLCADHTEANRFHTIEAQRKALFDGARIETPHPDAQPRLFGGFAYQPDAQATGIWSAFPSAYFVLPHIQLTQSPTQTWLTINHYMACDAELTLDLEAEALQIEAHILAETAQHATTANTPIALDYPLERPVWRQQITEATQRIKAGELDKVVLSRASEVTFATSINPLDALQRLQRQYPDTYRFMIEPAPQNAFFGATPELLAEVQGDKLTTVALAGSIRRGSTPDEDQTYGSTLLNSEKDRHEHQLVVHDIREQLEPLTHQLDIAAEPHLLKLSNIQHLCTPIEGKLSDANGGVLPVIEQLHPTPAMGGYPRVNAAVVLREIETVSRGWYAAPVGWLDPAGNGMFAVAIRSAITQDTRARLYAGVGIVANSDPDQEWDETRLKFRPMLDALGAQ